MADFQFLDKRVQNTKIDLFNSFFILLQRKNFKDIKVTDIIREAQCSRATFYTHYSHKNDLLEDIIQQLFKEMITAYRSTYIQKTMIDIQKLTDEPLNLLHHFKHFGEHYQLLLSDKLQIDFRARLQKVLVQLYIEDFELQATQTECKVNDSLLERYCGYGLAGLIVDWIEDDFPIEPDAFSEELVKVFRYLLVTARVRKKQPANRIATPASCV